jgi:hypothetical protein
MLEAFNGAAGKFTGGKDFVSFAVKAGQTGNGLTGYTHDDQVTYYNPARPSASSSPGANITSASPSPTPS